MLDPQRATNRRVAVLSLLLALGLADLGYLAADDVPAYIAAYEAAQDSSFLVIDGTKQAIESASPGEEFTITTASTQLVSILSDDGIEAAFLTYDDSEWELAAEPDYDAVPEALDPASGEGDLLITTLIMSDRSDPSTQIEVGLSLDVNIVGGGSSKVEVNENYALISGTLGTKTYIQLRDIMASEPQVDTLVLTQVDGSENDEINVHTARLIRDAGWTTWLPANGDISSGGVDMFAAGVNRFVEPGGFVGVHSWAGDDGEVGSDFPPDHPAHRSQLEYFSEMLGPDAGPEFYFYTLEASPAERIYRMTPNEIESYGLITGEAPTALPADIVGDSAAGYLEMLEGTYLKFLVDTCAMDGNSGEVDLTSTDFGETSIAVQNGIGELVLLEVEPAIAKHTVTDLDVVDGTLTATIDLNFGALVEGDTSQAMLAIPCAN